MRCSKVRREDSKAVRKGQGNTLITPTVSLVHISYNRYNYRNGVNFRMFFDIRTKLFLKNLAQNSELEIHYHYSNKVNIL